MSNTTLRIASIVSLALLTAAAGAQSSWPQYAGPSYTRTTGGRIGLKSWPADGPPVVWKVATKRGFSSFSVANGKAFTLVTRDRREACVALDVANGDELWATPFEHVKYQPGGDSGTSDNNGGDGPRSTPSYDNGRVYVFDARLVLHCLSATDGKQQWKIDLVADYSGRNISWQNAASPLIVGDAIFIAGGGKGESLLAVDKNTGKVLWKAHDERITHATPVYAEIHSVPQVIYFLQSGLVSVKPDDGTILWRIEYPFKVSTAASPVVDGDIVYCSAGYGVGAGAFRIKKTSDGFESELLWRKRNRLMNHWSTPVVKDGYLFGMFSFKKFGKGPMQCVDIRTGEGKWSKPGFGPGNCILVGDDLVALSDKGEVVLVEPKPDGYHEIARHDVLRGKCWSSPAFADGQVFVRSTVEAARVDLSGKKAGN